MLRLRRITVENFGPYKGCQSIDLTADDGVVIVYGENMRGKTSLLNSIRYALFGKVISRGERRVTLQQIGNWEAAKEGAHGFKVVLAFEHNGQQFELTRLCRLRDGVGEPTSEFDFVEECFLQRGTHVLGPEETRATLLEVMPEQVSRFFLFDGELLQQYEELLRDESDMGRRIKEAIERILGVPILTNARADLGDLLTEAQRQESKAAQKDQKTRELGIHHSRLLDEKANHEKEISRLSADLESLRTKKNAEEDALRRSERIKGLLQERDDLLARVEELDKRMEEREDRLRHLMADAWKWVLRPQAEAAFSRIQTEIDAIRQRDARRILAAEILESTQIALKEGKCSTCQQPLGIDAKQYLNGLLKEMTEAQDASAQDEGRLASLLAQVEVLRRVVGDDRSEVVRGIVDALDDLKIDREGAKTRIADIHEQTKNLDESQVRKLFSDYERTVNEIGVVERGIREESAALAKAEEDIKRIESQLDKVAGADLAKERRRRDLYTRLQALFLDGVGVYRDALRAQVQQDATDLFLQLTTEPDYSGLSINESYGLTIVHRDGDNIPVRSAGAEHIVALSLLGALQRNAPLRGPIIMDSPFGRLDEGHTAKVVQTLPNMAPQVVLLAFRSELDPKIARDGLKGRLRREYRIARQTARHSVIEPLGGN